MSFISGKKVINSSRFSLKLGDSEDKRLASSGNADILTKVECRKIPQATCHSKVYVLFLCKPYMNVNRSIILVLGTVYINQMASLTWELCKELVSWVY